MMRSQVLNELLEVYHDCRQCNWDGYGAFPVSEKTYQAARRFVELIPLGTLTPSVGVEPGGYLTLEWHIGPKCTLSASVNDNGDIWFAGICAGESYYGNTTIASGLSDTLVEWIDKIERRNDEP